MSINATVDQGNSTLENMEMIHEELSDVQGWILVVILFGVMVLVSFAGSVCILGGVSELFPCCGRRVQQQRLSMDQEEMETGDAGNEQEEKSKGVLVTILPDEKDRQGFLEIIAPSKVVTKEMLETKANIQTLQGTSTGSTAGSLSYDAACAICLADFKVGDQTSHISGTSPGTGCNHVFHKSCIEVWLETSASVCPVCRREIFSAEDAYRFRNSPRLDSNTSKNQ